MRRIFVSSTSADLGSYRRLASESLRRRGYAVDDQAIFDLTYLEISDKLKQRIAACDAVVCLIGFVYGGEPSNRPGRSAPPVVHAVGVLPGPRAGQAGLPAAGR